MNKRIITTNLKFAPHSQTGQIVSFISKVGDNWRGVSELSPLKKLIVVLDTELAKKIQEKMIYSCKLIPMSHKKGYVAVSASPLMFDGWVEPEFLPKTFKIKVHFGNQTIFYDPKSKDKRYNDFDTIVQYLISTQQIRNIGDVIEDLRKNINVMTAQYV